MMDLSFFLAGEDDTRTHLKTPFSVGDYTVATNGYIAVLTTDECEQEVNNNDEATNRALSCLLKAAVGINAEKQEIKLVDFKTVECKTCNGTGILGDHVKIRNAGWFPRRYIKNNRDGWSFFVSGVRY